MEKFLITSTIPSIQEKRGFENFLNILIEIDCKGFGRSDWSQFLICRYPSTPTKDYSVSNPSIISES